MENPSPIDKLNRPISQEYAATPDQALVKMDKAVNSFADHIRPICLASADVEERPICPDNSKDRGLRDFA